MFTSERGAPFATAGFAQMVERAGVETRLGFKAHAPARCGYGRFLNASWPIKRTTS